MNLDHRVHGFKIDQCDTLLHQSNPPSVACQNDISDRDEIDEPDEAFDVREDGFQILVAAIDVVTK